MANLMQRLARNPRDPITIDFTRHDLLLPSPLTFLRGDATTCATRRRMTGAVGPSRTNYLQQSTNMTVAGGWNVRGTCTATGGVADPFGGTTATTIAGLGTTLGADDFFRTQGTGLASGTPYTPSVWIDKTGGTQSGTFTIANPQNVNLGQAVVNLALLPVGWTRIYVGHPAVSVVNAFKVDATGVAGFHVLVASAAGTTFKLCASQIETSALPTPYIPTAGSVVTTTNWPRTNKINANVPRLGPNLATVTSADMTGGVGNTAITGNAAVVTRTYQVSYDYVIAPGTGGSQFAFGGPTGPVDNPGTSGSRSFTITATNTGTPTYFCNGVSGTIRNLKIQEQDLSGVSFTNAANNLATLTIVDDGAAMNASGLRTLVPSGLVWKLDNSLGNSVARIDFAGSTGNLAPHTLSAWTRGTNAGLTVFTGSDVAWNTLTSTGSTYTRVVGANKTPGFVSSSLRLNVSAGDIVYVVLPQLEEGTSATPVIVNTTGAALTVNTPPFGDLQTVVANAPRLEFRADGTSKGLRVEPALTNLLVNSLIAFNSLSFNPNGAVCTTGYPAPDGSTTAARITTSASSSFNFNNVIVAIGTATAVVQQLWIKPITLPQNFVCYAGDSTSVGGQSFSFTVASNLITAVSNGGTVENMGDGWQRISLPYTTTQAIGTNYTFGTTGVGFDAVFWQGQIYTPALGGSNLQSDVISIGASRTRAAESVALANLANLNYSASGWTIYVEVETQSDLVSGSYFGTMLMPQDAGGSNLVQLFLNSTGVVVNVQVAGVSTTQPVVGPAAASSTIKVALAMTPTGFSASVNGAAPVSYVGAVPLTLFTQALLGTRAPTGQDYTYFRGWIRKVMGWGRALSATELRAAST